MFQWQLLFIFAKINHKTMNVKDELIDRLIDLSFAEDIGDGDHTTLSTIPAEAMGKNMLLIKERSIFIYALNI